MLPMFHHTLVRSGELQIEKGDHIMPDVFDESPQFCSGRIVIMPDAGVTLSIVDVLLALQRHEHSDRGPVEIGAGKDICSMHHTKKGVQFIITTERNPAMTTVRLVNN